MQTLADFITRHSPLLVITGAGCSANSGIPTYRDATGEWQRSAPIQHRDFIASEANRRRYWCRSFAGWPAVAAAQPNNAHRRLAQLEAAGLLEGLVTQNVDGLHQRAGQRKVVDLHGRLDTVVCLDCGHCSPRHQMQARLAECNPGLIANARHLTPDGDAEVDDDAETWLRVPACTRCDGVLKPHVVFYGGAVEKHVVESVYGMVDQAKSVLVVGSSLMVFSAFRFVRRASQLGMPIAIVNRGVTRADELATLKLDNDCETALDTLGAMLEEHP